ncbi:MAG: hypothetical protein WBH86_00630 [Thermogutta sp.]|nr:hypothetical protein [Thermogutta sp.]HOP77733.1 hypothetical protein [Thermogutta sp.]HPU07165.1 hypothetical protein [Thermogutta sp.]HPZ83451.1 hypothetical protein [Thermogutta sp.]HQF14700.1 hypothetical protein [Thermogutta sp.]
MSYQNTQYGKWYWMTPLVLGTLLVIDLLVPGQPIPWFGYAIAGGTVAMVTLCFTSLTVRDGGDKLVVQFGPIPLVRATIPYRSITRVEQGRTNFFDGWGIHYSLTGGTVLNIWGFDCVRIWCGSRLYSIGTDDPDGLLTFLKNKLADLGSNTGITEDGSK